MAVRFTPEHRASFTEQAPAGKHIRHLRGQVTEQAKGPARQEECTGTCAARLMSCSAALTSWNAVRAWRRASTVSSLHPCAASSPGRSPTGAAAPPSPLPTVHIANARVKGTTGHPGAKFSEDLKAACTSRSIILALGWDTEMELANSSGSKVRRSSRGWWVDTPGVGLVAEQIVTALLYPPGSAADRACRCWRLSATAALAEARRCHVPSASTSFSVRHLGQQEKKKKKNRAAHKFGTSYSLHQSKASSNDQVDTRCTTGAVPGQRP